MTPDDFPAWVRFHESLFPGFMAFINAPERALALPEWIQEFAPYEPHEMTEASRQLWRLPDAERPRGYSAHCAVLIACARAARRSGDVEASAKDCRICGGTGRVSVVMRDGCGPFGRTDRGPVFEGLAACRCSVGSKFTNMVHFDRKRHLTWAEAHPPRPLEYWLARVEEMRSRGQVKLAERIETFLRNPRGGNAPPIQSGRLFAIDDPKPAKKRGELAGRK